MLFFDQTLKLTTGNNFKVFFEDIDDETPTSMEINFLHKIEITSNTSPLLWDWPTVKNMEYFLLCIKYWVHCPKQPIDAGKGKACLILTQEHDVKKVCQPLLVASEYC